MPDDSVLIFDHSFLKTATSDQVLNYIDARVDELVKMVASKPKPPTDEITAREHVTWRHRMLIHYGRCLESLLAAQAWGHITVEQFNACKIKLTAAINWKMSEVLIGG